MTRIEGKLGMNNEHKEDSPEQRVLKQIQYRLQTSRDRTEREVLKSLLLAVGITSLSNKTNKEYFLKK